MLLFILKEQVSIKEYIKKDIQKTAIIHFITGFIIISLFSLIYTSFANALLNGLIFSSIVSGYYLFYGRFSWNKRIKRSTSKKYQALSQLGILFYSDDALYEGVYKNFLIRIVPTSEEINNRWIYYDVIYAFYKPKDNSFEMNEPIKYYLGDLFFNNYFVYYVPKKFLEPDFQKELDGLVNILQREGYKPISESELNNLFT